MHRLLDESELALLAACPGFDSLLIQQLRSRRRRIYWAYLDEMGGDFRRLERIAVEWASNDPSADPLLLENVLRAKFRFLRWVWWMKFSLLLPFRWPAKRTRQLVENLTRPFQTAAPFDCGPDCG